MGGWFQILLTFPPNFFLKNNRNDPIVESLSNITPDAEGKIILIPEYQDKWLTLVVYWTSEAGVSKVYEINSSKIQKIKPMKLVWNSSASTPVLHRGQDKATWYSTSLSDHGLDYEEEHQFGNYYYYSEYGYSFDYYTDLNIVPNNIKVGDSNDEMILHVGIENPADFSHWPSDSDYPQETFVNTNETYLLAYDGLLVGFNNFSLLNHSALSVEKN